jgi:SAM-dependent methyltransferase
MRRDDEPSPRLAAFLDESPLARPNIAAFVRRAAASLPDGARVLDAGAGTGPYRELFARQHYTSTDWANTPHPEGLRADVIAPIHDLPLDTESFDCVICTEVIEHVADPVAALSELRRVLSPRGTVWVTAPFVWEFHEEPYDFFRYTRHGLRSVLERAGFAQVEVTPFGGCFTTLAQLLQNLGSIAGASGPAAPAGRRAVSEALRRAAPALARLDRCDRRGVLPLGHGAVGTATAAGSG